VNLSPVLCPRAEAFPFLSKSPTPAPAAYTSASALKYWAITELVIIRVCVTEEYNHGELVTEPVEVTGRFWRQVSVRIKHI